MAHIEKAEEVKKIAKSYKPGEKVPVSGQYEVTGPRGGSRGREVTSVKGEPFPPTQQAGERYVMVDKTKHKRD